MVDMPEQEKDDLLKDAREFLQSVVDFEGEDRNRAVEELRFLMGEQWDADAKRLRELEQRPCLTINTLPTFLHQVTNDARQNRTSIKVHPVDDGADEEKAEILQGLIRHIEYDSGAEAAYDTALEYAAAIGRGYWRLYTDYIGPDSFDQCIKYERIRNPFTVYFDPASKEADGSDQRRCMLSAKMRREDFQREYPNAEATTQGLGESPGDRIADWCEKDWVRVALFYRIEDTEATLVQLADGTIAYADDVPKGVAILRKRPSVKRRVMLYKVTAVDVLEASEVPCAWIPVFPVWGAELDLDGEVMRAGIVRHAKDPAKMYNYWLTSATEEVALRPKVPYIGAEGQFEGYEKEWREANRRSFSYLQYKPVTVSGQMAPPPQRAAMADIPAGALQMAAHARDNIKATTGIFDASLGARGNETSGRAIIARQREGDVANFHFVDNLRRAIRHCGRCLVSMIPRIYDAERVVRILGEDDTPKTMVVNQALPAPMQDEETGEVQTVLNDITVGKYDVTISAGPAYSTLRQEAADAMIQFGQAWPRLMDVAGDKVVKSMDWPGAEEIAERIAKTLPPELRDSEEEEAGPVVQTPQGPIPAEQAGQLIAQMMEQLQMMDQALDQAKSEGDKNRMSAEATIIREQIQAASREAVADIQAVSRRDVEELKGMVQLLSQQIQPPQILTAQALEVDNAAPDRI